VVSAPQTNKHKNTQTHRQDRLQYIASLTLARSVINDENLNVALTALENGDNVPQSRTCNAISLSVRTVTLRCVFWNYSHQRCKQESGDIFTLSSISAHSPSLSSLPFSTQTHRQDRLQYIASLTLARSVINDENLNVALTALVFVYLSFPLPPRYCPFNSS